MRKLQYISLTILLFILCEYTFAQKENHRLSKNYFSTSIIRPLRARYALRYERLIKNKHLLRVEIEYKIPRNTNSYENVVSFPFSINNKRIVTTGYSFSAGYGMFLVPKIGLYVATDLNYIYKFYENKYYYDGVGTTSDSHVYLESEFNNDFGIRPQVGFKIAVNKKNKVRLVIDPYAGIAIYYHIQKRVVYGESYGYTLGNFHYYETPKVTNKELYKLTTIIGVNIGIGF